MRTPLALIVSFFVTIRTSVHTHLVVPLRFDPSFPPSELFIIIAAVAVRV